MRDLPALDTFTDEILLYLDEGEKTVLADGDWPVRAIAFAERNLLLIRDYGHSLTLSLPVKQSWPMMTRREWLQAKEEIKNAVENFRKINPHSLSMADAIAALKLDADQPLAHWIHGELLTERGELDAPHGREVIGVLLFQDIAVVPLLVLIPALSQPVEAMAEALLVAALKAGVLLALVLVFGQRLLSAWFYMVARQKSAELFMLNVLLITLGLAWLTELAGLSLALGAFTAGMLIGETEYRYQVEEDIKPFRDVLLGLFFIAIGMRLDVPAGTAVRFEPGETRTVTLVPYASSDVAIPERLRAERGAP